uniref:WAP four-disulfide core domain protein 10A n=1 Tax=Jaculus jaculus TaxID=51337 RepID=UPI001E1B1E20|nr:WAP four-disulfide core domain protein 10A [Jaculus jaculus]
MSPQAQLFNVLLCALLLLLPPLAQGGKRKHFYIEAVHSPPLVLPCEKRPSLYLCKYKCENDRDCQANNVCCSTFCGNVCMNKLSR